jgi:hypothetical protein
VTSCKIRDRNGCTGTGPAASLFAFLLLIIILPLLHTHLSPPSEVCDSPDHAAHYHILALQVWGFIYDLAVGRVRNKEVSLSITGLSNIYFVAFVEPLLRNDREIVGYTRAVSGQRLGEHVLAAADTNGTIEELCFLCGPCRDIITKGQG